MKSAAKLSIAMLTTVLTASELDPKLIRLIRPDTRAIYGIHVERYRNSMLASFYPVWLEELSRGFGMEEGQIHQFMMAKRDGADGEMQLIMFRRAPSVPIVPTNEVVSMALLDSTTGIVGDADSVREAIGRWRQEVSGSGHVGTKARELSASYDNWFLIVRPLEKLDRARTASVLRQENDLRTLVEEVRGGIRLGAFNEVSVDVVMKTADDAAALAGASRWLPGFIQLQASHSPEGGIANLAENLAVTANGRIVSISFSLAESELEELARSRKASPIID
jgi:hypothetical protein